MKIFLAILAFVLLSTPCFAEDAKPIPKPNSFEDLKNFILGGEEEERPESKNKEPIDINRGMYAKNPFSAFDNNTSSFSNGGFISVSEYKQTNREKLDYAYKALSEGHTEVAIKTYDEILKTEPENKYAMFGIATAYHHNKQTDKAITTYNKLLEKHPDYKDAFNNLIVLLSNENPSKGLMELKNLEKQHPNFAPIPAQIGVINYKTNNQKEAVKYLTKALRIEPSNVVYKYNLAVALDKSGDVNSAKELYKQLLIANKNGEKIPVSENTLIDRLASFD